MLLSNRVLCLLLDSAELQGVSRDDIASVLGPDASAMLAPGGRVEWGTMVDAFDQVSRLVDDDEERLRAIGRGMRFAKSGDVVRDVARATLTARSLYEFIERWMTPAFPHLRMFTRYPTDHRVQIHFAVPEPHRTSLAFFYVLEGRLVALPELMNLGPATVLESRVTSRSVDLVLDLPRHGSLVARAVRALGVMRARPGRRKAMELQRQSLHDSIEALQRARDELRALLDRLPDPVLVHAGGRILWVNRALLETLGYDDGSEIVGSQLIDVVSPRSRSEAMVRMARSLDARPPLPAVTEFYLLTKGGDEVLIEVAPAQSVVFDGVPARMVVGRDVTERARMQQKLILADRLASIGLLAAGVAHEVNNPLAYVLNNIEIARKLIVGLGEKAETAHGVLGVALEGVDRIGVIVRDLLMLARGDGRPHDAIDLTATVRSTLTLASREVERTARLVVDIGPAPLVRASESRVAQILLNLVANAVEAMRGRPREASELHVVVGTASDGRFLLEVSDNGAGIAPSHLPRVFEPFFTTKAAGSGTGLGLSIAQRLVVELGGEISAASEEGRGTTFRVLFPAGATPISDRPASQVEA
ncbi:MAG: PAS domain S-box protein [Deltaproteobacteria bacterium]|nr:PAS domain S-box protein [Deltaproteobacteria bacterium]